MVSRFSTIFNYFYFYGFNNDSRWIIWHCCTCNFKKNKLEKLYDVDIEYLEIRNKKNLQLSKKIKDSKMFVAYYLKNVRLIDNF